MRNMSFALTTAQFKARTKTVTRRLGWADLGCGDVIQGCEKCQGIKPGEKMVKLGAIRCVSNHPESLAYLIVNRRYGKAEVIKEGFPHLTARQFVKMFCEHMKVEPFQVVNRIEFEYVEPWGGGWKTIKI